MIFFFKDKYLTENEKEKDKKLKDVLNTIVFGIHFDKKESEFINTILSNRNNKIQPFFGSLYDDFIKKIFN